MGAISDTRLVESSGREGVVGSGMTPARSRGGSQSAETPPEANTSRSGFIGRLRTRTS